MEIAACHMTELFSQKVLGDRYHLVTVSARLKGMMMLMTVMRVLVEGVEMKGLLVELTYVDSI